MAKLIDLDGLAYFYGKIKAMLAEKLGKNDTAVNASKVNNLTVETAVPKNAKFTDTVYTHPSTHPASMITGLASVATSGSYNDLTDKPTIPAASTVDSELSSTSTNPVQNKVIKEALDGKLGKNETAARATQDGAGNTISTTYASKTDVSAALSTKLGVNSTAYAATRDGAGNNIVDTYAKKTDISGFVKTVNGTAPDTGGNVTINVSGGSGGVSTSEANTWTAAQTFNSISKYKMETLAMLGFNISPTTPSIFILAESNITINLDALCAQVAEGKSMIFRAYILCADDGKQYTLTIEHTEGNVFITGDNTDYAISQWGIILTAYIARASGMDDVFVILSATKITGMKLS